MLFTRAALAFAACTFPLFAQTQPSYTRFTLVPELRINAAGRGYQGTQYVTVAPDGRIILVLARAIVVLDSAGQRELWRMNTNRGDDSEVSGANRIGWRGNSMWIGDEGFSHVALVDDKGVVTRSLPQPTWIKPTWADRKTFPVWESMDVLGLYADRSMIVMARSPAEIIDVPSFDRNSVYFVRINEEGTIQKLIGTVPFDDYLTFQTKRGGNAMIAIPYQNRTFWAVSADGARFAVVSAAVRGADSATFRVTSINERADTVFSRRYPFAAQAIPASERDSAAKRLVNLGGVNLDAPLARLRQEMPPVYPPVRGVFLGRDRSFWLTLWTPRADTASRTHLILKSNGDPVGIVTTSAKLSFRTADYDRIWGFERARGEEAAAIVRYRLVPAK